MANLIVQISKALASAARVQAVLDPDTKPGMAFPQMPEGRRGSGPRRRGGSRFDHVGLTYAGAGAPQPDRHHLHRPSGRDHRGDRGHRRRQIQPWSA